MNMYSWRRLKTMVYSGTARVEPIKNLGGHKGVGSREKHNYREYNTKVYDKNKNIVLKNESYESAINTLLEPYIKQHKTIEKNKNRHYHNGLDYIKKQSDKNHKKEQDFFAKNGVFEKNKGDKKYMEKWEKLQSSEQSIGVELIFQLGGVEQGTPFQDTEQVKDYYKNVLLQLEDKYKDNLKVTSAVVHFDEETPHMHIIGIPHQEANTKLGIKIKGSAFLTGRDQTSDFQSWAHDIMQQELYNLGIEGQVASKKPGRNYNLTKNQLKTRSAFIKALETKEKEVLSKTADELYNLAYPIAMETLGLELEEEKERGKEKIKRELAYWKEEQLQALESNLKEQKKDLIDKYQKELNQEYGEIKDYLNSEIDELIQDRDILGVEVGEIKEEIIEKTQELSILEDKKESIVKDIQESQKTLENLENRARNDWDLEL